MLVLKSIKLGLLSIIIVILSDYLCNSDGDLQLFETGWIKFHKRGQRQLFHNVQFIEPELIGIDPRFLTIRAKYVENLHRESVRNFRNLLDLSLIKCGIETINPGAFQNLTNLTTLQLQDNQIETIRCGIFNRLKSIKILLLHRNRIHTIETDSFNNMTNLIKIKLNNNRLKFWDFGWFINLTKLKQIFLRRNRIEHLPDYLFGNLTIYNNRLKVFLSKNKLGRNLNKRPFINLVEIGQLWLDRNNITKLPDEIFNDLLKVDVLNLARNRIVQISDNILCNIKRIGILDLSSNLLETIPYRFVQYSNLTNLEKTNFTCDEFETIRQQLISDDRQSQIVTGKNC